MPAKENEEDVIIVKMYGHDVKVPRGDTPDADWQDLKAKAQKTNDEHAAIQSSMPPPSDQMPPPSDRTDGSRAGAGASNPPRVEVERSFAGESDSVRPIREIEKQRSQQGWEESQRQSYDESGTHGIKRFVEQGLKVATPPEETPAIPGGEAKRAKTPAGKAVNSDGEEVQKAIVIGGKIYVEQPAGVQMYNPPPEEDDGKKHLSNEGKAFRNQGPDMALKKAVGLKPDQSWLDTAPFQGTPAFTVPGGQSAAGPMPDVPGPAMPPSPPEVLGGVVKGVAGAVAKPLAEKWGGTMEGKAAMGTLGAPPPGAPSGAPPGTPPPPGPPGGGGPAGGLTSLALGGSMTVPPTDVQIPEYPIPGQADAMKKAYEDEAKARTEGAKIESDSYKQIAAEAEKTQRSMLDSQARMQALHEAGAKRQDAVFKTIQEAQAVLNNPAKTPDPERYWKNHSKVLFAIGVGLLAANNRDISGVLHSVDNAIKNDIDAQKAEFEAPRDAAKAKVAGGMQLYGMFRQQGLDAYEAERAAQITMSQMSQQYIQQIAASSKSDIVKANAREMNAKQSQEQMQKADEMQRHAKELGIREYSEKTQRITANAKAAEGGRNLSAEEKKRLEFSKNGIEIIHRVKQLLGPEQKFSPAMWDEVTKSLPWIQTKAKTKDQAVELLKTSLATAIAQSSLQAHEQKRLLESGLMSGVGFKNQSQLPLDELERLFAESVGRIEGSGQVAPAQPVIQMGPPR
jgi:hypothetical protein